jgi:predicted unusual protein kinase regulating ubiquinone biosynthesis (AarF/ABC1/UbiB family)
VFTGIKRAAQLGLLARDMAGVGLRRPGPGADRARGRLVDRLGSLHGLPQKIGQLLALSEMGESANYAPLTESCSPLPARDVFALLEKSLGRKVGECFHSLDPAGIAASLGQVHRARLPDGRAVAVKVQYPDSAAHVETDLTALTWLTAPFGGLGRGFDLASYRRAIGGMLRRELDYCREAESLRRFGALAAGCEWVAVPEVVPELCTDRVLTMTWMEGDTFDAVHGWPEEQRRQAARSLLRLFLTSCFGWRLLHGDPHPGNYRFRRTGGGVQVGLLDFGCVEELEESRAGALAALIEAARQGSAAPWGEVLALYEALGFNPDLLLPLAHLLPALNHTLFEPFATAGPFRVSSWKLGERVERVLGPFRWNFRFAGPANLIFVLRAYLGLLRYLHALDVVIDWSEAWLSLGERPACSLPGQARRLPHNKEGLSRHLRVRVEEGGQVRVDLTFKAALAESLADLVPPELEDKLRDRGLDVRAIAAGAVERDFAAGELFRLAEGTKLVRVWLE